MEQSHVVEEMQFGERKDRQNVLNVSVSELSL